LVVDRTWLEGDCRCSWMRWLLVVEMCQFEYWNSAGVCTCRHSDAQLSRGPKWGLRDERGSTLGVARSPLYIEVGECRAVVWYTCVWRLQNRGKCNREWKIRGNMGKETLKFVWSGLSCSVHPLEEGVCFE